MLFCCSDDGDHFFTQLYKSDDQYVVNISDCVEENFDSLTSAYAFMFPYISRAVRYDQMSRLPEELKSNLLAGYPFYASCLITSSINYITQDLIYAAACHELTFCRCHITNKRAHKLESHLTKLQLPEKILIVEKSNITWLNDLLKEYYLQFIEYQPKRTGHGKYVQINGMLSSNKEISCFYILKTVYPDLEQQVQIPETRKTVDYFSRSNKLVIEFLGDFYHGNLDKFDKDTTNPKVKKTYQELHDNTFKRFDILKQLGYNIQYIWESDWDKIMKGTLKDIKEAIKTTP